MSKKLLGCLMSLVILCFNVAVQAQDLCDSYHDKYQVCVEAREAGSNVDYDDCGTYTDETNCTNAGCYWNDQGLPSPGVCVVDVCLADADLSGRITGVDLNTLKKELGRMDCKTEPDVPVVPLGITCEGTLSTLGRWCDQGDGTVKDMTTGLVWLQDASCMGEMDWYNAIEKPITDLRDGDCSGTLADGSVWGDWRLPTRSELEGITVGNEYIRSNQMYFFTGVQSGVYWSSITLAGDTGDAWYVNMINGNVTNTLKGNVLNVWPVRGATD